MNRTELALRAVKLAVLMERTKCIFDICSFCAQRSHPEFRSEVLKHRGPDGVWHRCKAAAIHLRSMKTVEKETQ